MRKPTKQKPLKVLFISGELIAGDLAYRLVQEGCDVKLYIEDKSRKDCLEGMVPKTEDWKKELKWIGKDGLIVFDDIGYGKIQDELREKGYSVLGGSAGGDRLEKERNYCQKIFSVCGIDPLETHDFENTDSAIDFLNEKENRRAWVLKQNGHHSIFNYIGEMDDGSDVLSLLLSYKKHLRINVPLTLQKRVRGVEIGIARYFNGNDWIGPIEFNIEHKQLCNDCVGPLTGEMGTVIWYDNNDKNVLFQKTLAKLKPFLKKINFKGDFDINCIINKRRVYPIEATSRFGCPSTQLQDALNLPPWKAFLMAIAKGEKYHLRHKEGYGVIVSLAIPPFPSKVTDFFYIKGAEIKFKGRITKSELSKIHFEEVSSEEKDGKKTYHIAGNNGYIAYISSSSKTISGARKKVYSIVNKIIIPRVFYRTDIGKSFYKKDKKLLKKWGWL
ncbi:MAG: hypothetical protein NTU76_01805 [Candidatus Taylorbacteria bacterium]|nr:hypothetical protein [Candidatus Taylorbacteria bacterium]